MALNLEVSQSESLTTNKLFWKVWFSLNNDMVFLKYVSRLNNFKIIIINNSLLYVEKLDENNSK
jgi:hypothetical protein